MHNIAGIFNRCICCYLICVICIARATSELALEDSARSSISVWRRSFSFFVFLLILIPVFFSFLLSKNLFDFFFLFFTSLISQFPALCQEKSCNSSRVSSTMTISSDHFILRPGCCHSLCPCSPICSSNFYCLETKFVKCSSQNTFLIHQHEQIS